MLEYEEKFQNKYNTDLIKPKIKKVNKGNKKNNRAKENLPQTNADENQYKTSRHQTGINIGWRKQNNGGRYEGRKPLYSEIVSRGNGQKPQRMTNTQRNITTRIGQRNRNFRPRRTNNSPRRGRRNTNQSVPFLGNVRNRKRPPN